MEGSGHEKTTLAILPSGRDLDEATQFPRSRHCTGRLFCVAFPASDQRVPQPGSTWHARLARSSRLAQLKRAVGGRLLRGFVSCAGSCTPSR
jgi:hypothetical protein